MNIDKAIRKQRKSYRRFMLSMGLIFFILPAALVFSRKIYAFYIIYLAIIEVLILLAFIMKVNNELLLFNCDGCRLKIILGVKKSKLVLTCRNVMAVHVERDIYKDDKNIEVPDFKIIVLTDSKFRSNRIIPVNVNFLKKHSYAAGEYSRLKSIYPDKQFYYTVIKRAGIKKYPLLDCIYKNCVYAHFTEDAIDVIKFYRDNSGRHNLTANNYK